MPGTDDEYPFRGTAAERLPESLRQWATDLTYTELHAMELGLLGVLAATGWHAGFRPPAVGFTVAAVAIAFGLRALPEPVPVAARVVRREPWYFTTVYVVTTLLTSWSYTLFPAAG